MIDNFDKFPWEFVDGEFYFIQILDRNRSASSNNGRCIKSYYIDSKEYLEKRKSDMVKIANDFNSRIYIHPSRRSKYIVALDVLTNTADHIRTNTLDRMWRIYETSCGKNTGTEKIWIVDVDTKDEAIVLQTINSISSCKPYKNPYNTIETVSGYHLLYKGGFDRKEYSSKALHVWDIHTNNPTILYAPNNS